MIYLTLITIYLLSVLAMRSITRFIYKHDIWLAEDCMAETMWFVPVINTFVSIFLFISALNKISKKKKNRIKGALGKLFNHDLPDRY
jgi:hypothetical protein